MSTRGFNPNSPSLLRNTATFNKMRGYLQISAQNGNENNLEISNEKVMQAENGTIVTLDLNMKQVGDFSVEPLFDMNERVSFVVGYGNYLPGLHSLLRKKKVGDSVEDVLIDAGWGESNPNLIVKIPIEDIKANESFDITRLKVGNSLRTRSGGSCVITEITDETFTIDANPPLVGTSYSCSFSLLELDKAPESFLEPFSDILYDNNKYQVATFALGCFWGVELALMRVPGVVGTKVGYTQGHVPSPSYEDVCSETTGHTEAIMIVFDSDIISYHELVCIATDRLGDDMYFLDQVGNDKGTQYRHGIYYHTRQQRQVASQILNKFGRGVRTELKQAKPFYDAEEYHQQYLLKGGQSAKKRASEPIRCYG